MTQVIFPFIGGIGLFLVGMMLLSEGLVAFAGPALRKALIRFTGTPGSAFVSGALATAIVQSSSATTVTMIGFVSAGLLTFSQALGFIIGTSLGNTATGWIVTLLGLKINFGFYTLPLIGIGALLRLLGHGRSRDMGVALAGFGLIFLGLTTLQNGMRDVSSLFNLAALPVGGFSSHVLIMLLGLGLTVVLQSSSAAIATTLTALYTHTINFDQAAALVVGAAIGTTATGALVALGATISARRTAYANILFNLFAGLIAIASLPAFLAFTHFLARKVEVEPGPLSLVLFHTLFISVGALLVMPFINRFARLVERLLPTPQDDIAGHLDDSLLSVPAVALEASQRALEAVAGKLFNLTADVLRYPQSHPNARTLSTLHDTLEQIYPFISRVPLGSDEGPLVSRRIAQLHATDHLMRLRLRLGELAGQDIDMTAAPYDWVQEWGLQLLEGAQNSLHHATDPEKLDQINQAAAALSALSDEARQTLLQSPHTGPEATSAPALLRQTDALRWVARTAHHIARISHYLSAGHLNGNTMQPAAPTTTTEENQAPPA